ncbi:MAG: GyrI-like domain-containing protein [Chloroflexota bacterium]
MSDLNVRIVNLPAMRVICFNGFGKNPEDQAYTMASKWLKDNGMWETRKDHQFFGYDNPDPSPGSPNYGYDVWVTVDEMVQAGGGGRIIDFPGGLFAVTHVDAGPNGEGIHDAWQALAAWVENSKYTPEFHKRHYLEESPDPFQGSPNGFAIELYEPIRE